MRKSITGVSICTGLLLILPSTSFATTGMCGWLQYPDCATCFDFPGKKDGDCYSCGRVCYSRKEHGAQYIKAANERLNNLTITQYNQIAASPSVLMEIARVNPAAAGVLRVFSPEKDPTGLSTVAGKVATSVMLTPRFVELQLQNEARSEELLKATLPLPSGAAFIETAWTSRRIGQHYLEITFTVHGVGTDRTPTAEIFPSVAVTIDDSRPSKVIAWRQVGG
jgi:hypothetical protein